MSQFACMEYNRIGMKKYASIAIILTLLLAGSAFAEVNTDINVSNNGSNSSSHVTVNNSVNSSSNSTNTSDSHTDIKIETNGEVKEYHSDDPGSISVQSDNGVAQVKINGATLAPSKSSMSGEEKMEATASPHTLQDASKAAEMKRKSEHDFMEFINQQIERIKDFFKNFKIF